MQTFELLCTFNYAHLWLELSNQEEEKAWQQAQNCSKDSTKWQAYLNALTVNALLPWLEEMSGEDTPRLWATVEKLPQLWEFVNGTAIQLGNTRLVLIPQETADLTEIVVPQEWLDIPSWAADYYLAVQVNTEDGWLRCWGYGDYETIKQRGEYSPISKTYSLPQEELQEDLTLLLVTQKFSPYYKPNIPVLPQLAPEKAEELIQNSPSILIPRVAIPFSEWGAFIANDHYRERLYQSRQPLSITAWLEKSFTAAAQLGWQSLTSFIDNNLVNLTPQLAMRSTTAEAIDTLYHSGDAQKIKNAAFALGRISPGSVDSPGAIAALAYALETCEDDDARWAAAETLWLLDADNPMVGIWQGKKIDLGIDIGKHSLGLIVAILPKPDNTISIFLRVYPLGDRDTLPANLSLQILDDADEVFKEITTRTKDNLIQYKFWGQPGEEFKVSLILGTAKITESFII